MNTTTDESIGEFAGRLISWRRLISLAATPEARLKMYERAIGEVATFVSRGLDRTVAADELFDMAVAHEYFGQSQDEIQNRIANAFGRIKPNGKDRHEEPEKVATQYVFPDEERMPAREWIYGGHYVIGAACATVAPGGYGKTTLTLFECVDMASQGKRVWYISGEDPRDEIDRRIIAHCKHNPKLDRKAIAANLWVDDKVSFPLFLGTSTRNAFVSFNGVDNRTPQAGTIGLDHFAAQIEKNRILVVCIDPFISFHSVPENDNGAIDQVVKRLALIAQRRKCCIEISHHTRKPILGQDELTVDDARGGAAIVNAVRSARVINRMSMKEAGTARVQADKRTLHIRVDKGKRNMAPAEAATWWQIVSVDLLNGDNVQAIERWPFPSAFDGMSSAERDWIVELLRDTGPRRKSSQSPDWLGHDLALHCNRSVADKAGVLWANEVIGTWVRNKVFKDGVMMRGPDRRKVEYYAHNDFVNPEQESADVLPFEKPKEKPKRERIRIIDDCEPNTRCVKCGLSEGEVFRCKDVSKPGEQSETLHKACAEAWFDGLHPPRGAQ